MLRERLFATLHERRARGRGGLRGPGRRARARRGARLARRRTPATGAGSGSPFRGTVGATARATSRASARRGRADVEAGRPGRRRCRRRLRRRCAHAGRRGGAGGSGWPTPRCRRPRTTSRAALHALRGARLGARGLTSDTALAAYLARPGQRSFDLADLALRYLRRELRRGGEPATPATSSRSSAARRRPTRRARRPQMVRGVARWPSWPTRSTPSWPSCGGTELLAELELPLLRVLADLEAAGIAVDARALLDAGGRVRRAGAGRPRRTRTT